MKTAFELLQDLYDRNEGVPLEQLLQNVATTRCSGAHWAYVSENEMREALEKELK